MMKTSTRFIVIFICGFLVSFPLVDLVHYMLLKEDMKRALAHFTQEHCQEEVTITKFDVPNINIPYMGSYSHWVAESDIGIFSGSIYKGKLFVLLKSSPCTEINDVYLLDRKKDIFYSIPNSSHAEREAISQRSSLPVLIYYVVFIAGMFVWSVLMYIEKKKDKGSK